jgi:predicted ferric reductase
LNSVRRRFYSFFYMSHILVAPLFLAVVMLHYNRGILYIAPSVLYYVASSLPVFQEQKSNPDGAKILEVTRVASGRSQFVSLTFEASNEAMTAYRPGTYVKMSVPSISKVAHPFTINKVPDRENQLRIIFRAMGKFTNDLADKMNEGEDLPAIHLDGYHGCPDRIEKLLQHDAVVLVAAGIGITPFLSLLSEVVALTSSSDVENNSFATRKVVLHWMCRDAALVHYIRQDYFEPLLQAVQSEFSRCQVEIIIHQTASSRESLSLGITDIPATEPLKRLGRPFAPSQLSPGASIADNLNKFVTHTTIAWVGLVLVWCLYSNVQSEEQIWQRVLAPLAISGLGYIVSALATRLPITDLIEQSSSLIDKRLFCFSSLKKDATTTADETTHLMSGVSIARVDSFASCFSLDEENPCEIMLRTSKCRPHVHNLLKETEGRDYPGVFCCGPSALTHEIYEEVHRRSQMEEHSCITVYDEVFLI